MLAFLFFSAGLSSSLLGMGGGALIAVFLPPLASFSAKEAVALALFFSLTLSALNSFIFALRGRSRGALRPALALALAGGGAAFLSGFAAKGLSDMALRLILLIFLMIIAAAAFLKKLIQPQPRRLMLWGAGALMGLASGLCGFSGGAMASPLLHELKTLPPPRIAPALSLAVFFLSLFALLGWTGGGLSLAELSAMGGFFKTPIGGAALGGLALAGLALGHALHQKTSLKARLLLLRVLTGALFLQVFIEALFSLSSGIQNF